MTVPSSSCTAPVDSDEVENIPLSRPPVACVVLWVEETSGRGRSPSFRFRVMTLVLRSSVKAVA